MKSILLVIIVAEAATFAQQKPRYDQSPSIQIYPVVFDSEQKVPGMRVLGQYSATRIKKSNDIEFSINYAPEIYRGKRALHQGDVSLAHTWRYLDNKDVFLKHILSSTMDASDERALSEELTGTFNTPQCKNMNLQFGYMMKHSMSLDTEDPRQEYIPALLISAAYQGSGPKALLIALRQEVSPTMLSSNERSEYRSLRTSVKVEFVPWKNAKLRVEEKMFFRQYPHNLDKLTGNPRKRFRNDLTFSMTQRLSKKMKMKGVFSFQLSGDSKNNFETFPQKWTGGVCIQRML